MEEFWHFLLKNIHRCYDPAIPVLDICLRKMPLHGHQNDMYRNVHCSIILKSSKVEAAQKFVIKEVDKL